MTARYIVGDVFDVLASLEPASVDLVMTSPPFLALRSYLPADHPDKAREIGSEATPGEFIDTMLDVVEACARVLTPHGSLVFELGDTYAGSGGAGGDYNDGGLRDGVPGFDGSARRTRKNNLYTSGYSGGVHGNDTKKIPGDLPMTGGKGWPLDKSKVLIPQLFAIALVYGFNPLTGRQTEPWRVRNTVAWCRPNPPVGRDGDKFRPATSFLTVACKARDRYWDGDAVRSELKHPGKTATTGARSGDGDHRALKPYDGTDATSAGAPLLDWWEIPTQPYAGSHYATYPANLVVPIVKSMCPQRVCRVCGMPSRRITADTSAFDAQPLLAAHIKERREALGITSSEVNGWFGYKEVAKNWERTDTGGRVVNRDDWPLLKERLGLSDEFDGFVLGDRRWKEDAASYESTTGGRVVNHFLGDQRAEGAKAWTVEGGNPGHVVRKTETLGWSDCGHNDYRPGLVLDCFAGSGTTLQVATGHGRDAIGIDLDSRNAELAVERIGGLFLTVEHHGEQPATTPGPTVVDVGNSRFRAGYQRRNNDGTPQGAPQVEAYGAPLPKRRVTARDSGEES